MKTGKELKINSFKNYNVVFGSVNNKHPKALYINITAWAEPKSEEEINYSRAIRDLHKRVKQNIYNHFKTDPLSEFLADRSIVDLDIRESGVKFGKRSFMSCEITLFLTSEIPVNSEHMQPILNDIVKMIVDTSFDDCRYFSFHKKKS